MPRNEINFMKVRATSGCTIHSQSVDTNLSQKRSAETRHFSVRTTALHFYVAQNVSTGTELLHVGLRNSLWLAAHDGDHVSKPSFRTAKCEFVEIVCGPQSPSLPALVPRASVSFSFPAAKSCRRASSCDWHTARSGRRLQMNKFLFLRSCVDGYRY